MRDLASLSPQERRALLAQLLEEKAGQQLPASQQSQPKTDSYPLSFAQQRLWFLDKLQPGSGAYNVCRAFWLHGDLNMGALAQAVRVVVGRHQSLRTTFDETEDGRPIQIISPDNEPAFSTVDLRGETADPRGEALKQMREAAVRPFDLRQGPLIRSYLWQTAEEEHLFLVVMHHIISDAWSLSVFFGELSAVYGAAFEDRTADLPPLPLQYTDYAQQQRQRLQGETLDRHLAFWQAHLAGRPPLLELPTGQPRPPAQTFGGREYPLALSKPLSDGLKALSRRQKTTPYTVLLAAFNLLLGRYTSSSDIVVGSPGANRNEAGIQSLIGFFVNVMPLRTDLSGNPTFLTLVERVKETLIGTMAHNELPFERLVEEIQPERDLSRHPVFQVVFAMQNVPDDRPVLPGLMVAEQTVPVQHSKFDLTLFLKETAAGYAGTIEYSTDLFLEETIARLGGHFQTLLAEVVANPNGRLSELPIFPNDERRQLTSGWNQTQRPYSIAKLVHHLVEAQAAKMPDKTAVTTYKSAAEVEGQLTFGELNRRANQLAHYLRRLGVGPETPVGVCMERSAELVVALLGVLKAGGAYLPLDPVYPRERLAFMLQDAAQRLETAEPILITQPWLKEQMPDEGVRHIYLDSNWEGIAQEPEDGLGCTVTAENLAYIIYTSGTTGRPKGIQLEHRTLLNLIYWHQRAFDVTAADKATQLAGPAFDASVWELWPYLMAGASIHIPDDETRLLPWQMRDWLVGQGITISFLPTPLVEAILGLDWPEQVPLRTLLTGGDKLTVFPPDGLPFELINNYGPTENTVVTTSERTPPGGEVVDKVSGHQFVTISGGRLLQNRPHNSANLLADGRLPPIGRPIDNVQVYITDKYLNPVPVGVPGELLIGGESLARGYLNRPDLTAAAFVPDPFHPEPGRRLYRTGDLAKYLADGRIAFLGRIDQQVKIRGFRIEIGEIERVLQQHTAVSEAIVLAREDLPGDKRLVGYVIAQAGKVVETDELRQFLGERLPEYMVPVLFISLSEWPMTPNGKIDRRALPLPDWSAVGQGRTFTPPRTPAEETLAAIWQAVLGVERVGVDDNFFELGGDSILSIQILARANQAGFQLTTRQLFQHQTIATLAANLGQGEAQVVAAEQGRVTGEALLTPIQQWFFEQDLVDAHHWNMAMVLATRPNLSPETLAQTFQALLAHHDALRLRYVNNDGRWIQHYVNISDDESETFSYVNLGDLPEGEREAVFRETAERVQSSLNLEAGPLIRAVYFDYNQPPGGYEDGRLLIVVHHLVMDGVSWRILLEDLHHVYEQVAAGRSIQLPPKTVSFQQWSKALAAYPQSEAVSAEIDDWMALPWEEVRPLPLDFPEQAEGVLNTVGTAETVSISLTRAETKRLLQSVPAAYGGQINDILLTALAETMADWAGSIVTLVDLEGHGREPLGDMVLDTSWTVGWFTTMYPVLLAVETGIETAEQVTTVQEQLARVPGKGLGYGLLRYLQTTGQTAEKLARLPQAEISFNYLGQYDNLLPPESPFSLSGEPVGSIRSPNSERKHLLNINAQVRDGCLEIAWTFSQNHHQEATIAGLAERYAGNLRRLISERAVNGVPRPVYEALRETAGPGEFEAIYPLAPGQAAMLAHSRAQPESPAYFLQWVYGFEGPLDTAAFRRAWELVAARHQILRTLFETAQNGRTYQLVLREPGLDWQVLDWREMAAGSRAEKLAAWLVAERERGFRPSTAPPLRFTVVCFGEQDFRFIWSHHHALLDGWSMAPLWGEVLAAYEALRVGERPELPEVVGFGHYLDWVRRQPKVEAAAYWRRRLAGIGRQGGGRQDGGAPVGAPYGWVEQRLAVGQTAALEQFAKGNRLTLNTVMQGAWARVLAARSGQADVVFGVTAVGRPSAIPGVERMVGLLLNTLPVRVQVPDELADKDEYVTWLQHIQEQQAARSQFEHVSLAQVEKWVGGMERPLFRSFLRFQNYPMKQFLEGWQGSLRIWNDQVFDQWHYPLSVVVVPGPEMVLRIGYDGGMFKAGEVEEMLVEFGRTITQFT